MNNHYTSEFATSVHKIANEVAVVLCCCCAGPFFLGLTEDRMLDIGSPKVNFKEVILRTKEGVG